MGHYILDNAVIYTEQGKIENGYIEIQDGYIQDIQEKLTCYRILIVE